MESYQIFTDSTCTISSKKLYFFAMKTFQPHLQAFRDGGELYRLFEHIPDVLFFAKDGEGRLIMGNQRFVEHCGLSLIDELAGKSDYDIFPNYMADKFATDDQAVLGSGKPLLHLVELFPSPNGTQRTSTRFLTTTGKRQRFAELCRTTSSHSTTRTTRSQKLSN